MHLTCSGDCYVSRYISHAATDLMPPVYPADLYASCFFPAVCQSIKPDDLLARRIISVSRYNSGPAFEGRRTDLASDTSTSRPIDFTLGYEAPKLAGNPADLLGGFFRLLATTAG